jgi:WD40 repeat protein
MVLIASILFIVLYADCGAQERPVNEVPVTAVFRDAANNKVWKGSQAGLDCFDTLSSKLLLHVDCGLSEIHTIRPTRDGNGLLVGGGQAGQVGQVVKISIAPPHQPAIIATTPDVIYCIDCCGDSENHFATSCWDGICRVYTLASDKPTVEYQGHAGPVLSLLFLDDKLTVASAGVDNTIQLWNGGSGQRIRTLDNHTAAVHALALRPNPGASGARAEAIDLWIASASEDRTVRFWQPMRGRMVRFAKFHSIPRSIEWSENGDRLIAEFDDGNRVEVDPNTARLLDTN